MLRVEQIKAVLEGIVATGKLNLDSIQDLSEKEKTLIRSLYDEGLVKESLQFVENLDVDKEWEEIKGCMEVSKRPALILWKPILKYAAIFVGLITAVYVFQFRTKSVQPTGISHESIKLRTADDQIKVINEGEELQIVSGTGVIVGIQQGNKIKYNTNPNIHELVYNELNVPYGKIFDLELSDGTLVHLNSGTKIKYPVKFLKGRKREVFIEGEAYFAVAKDKGHPFVVHADAVSVEVLGTIFNISSYKEDNEINTVLVEGSVSMANTFAPNDHLILEPGTKGAWNKTDYSTHMEEVDVETYTGWVNGELVFRNSSFADMVKRLERKYNVSIQNNNLLLDDLKLNARFSTEIENIGDVLKSISEIYPFNYRVTDRNIVID